MTPHRPKFARGFAFALAACSVALLALACDAELPTSEQVKTMDVAAAEGAAQRLAIFGANDSLVTFTIDGRNASAQEAHALTPGEIATIEVLKKKIGPNDGPQNERGEVRILTRKAADSLGVVGMRKRTSGEPAVLTVVRRDTLQGGSESGALHFRTQVSDTVVVGERLQRKVKIRSKKPFDGVLLLNGVRVDNRELANISPDQIVSVEVVKGDAARKLFADSAATNGVIRITTRSEVKKR